jgi:hypothetical protein
MERCAAGELAATTDAERFPARKYHVSPTRTTSATIPATNGASVDRFFGSRGFAYIAGLATVGFLGTGRKLS